MKRGKVLEAVAAELYQERTGRKLWRSNQIHCAKQAALF